MGACDLTDGTYCWPEGLTHYIMEHQVRLPDEIVRHILSQSKFPSKKAAQAVEGIETDTTWWQQQQGWCPASSSFLSGDDQEEKDYLRRFDRNQTYFNDTSEAVVAGREELIQSLREKFGNG